MTFKGCTCSKPQPVRSRRRNAIERLVSRFGYFPWACKRCAWRYFRKVSGTQQARPTGKPRRTKTPSGSFRAPRPALGFGEQS